MELYLIKVKNLKPIWQRLGFGSEKIMLQNKKRYDRLD